MRIGSLFSGAGGLDLAVQQVFGGETVWHCENDPAASKVLEAHWPDTPNLGDITTVHWPAYPDIIPEILTPIDILCGGFPCQDVSIAAVDRRAGLATGTRSGLWTHMAQAIHALQPALVVIENVRGLLSAAAHRDLEPDNPTMGNRTSRPVLRAAGAILGDLADLGYDAVWATVAASDVGAPHRRERVFIVAHTASNGRYEGRPEPARFLGGSDDAAVRSDGSAVTLLPTPTTQDASNCGGPAQLRRNTLPLNAEVTLLPTPSSSDGIGGGPNDPINRRGNGHQIQLIDLGMHPGDTEIWGRYTTAIQRWESLTRPAPPPTVPSPRGKYGAALNPAFAEWMMGWPKGWVTTVDGISRNDQLRIIGNGVCPQQAAHAITYLARFCTVPA